MNRMFAVLAGLAALIVAIAVWLLLHPRAQREVAGNSRTPETGMTIPRSPLAMPSRIRAPEKAATPVALTPPGAKAFRKYTDGFVAQQAEATREHMAREKVTLEETKELTYFALTAMESQDWDVVADKVGHPISDEVKRQVMESMNARSQEMARGMREAIERGASDDERWAVIDRVEQDYLSDYYRLTGMNDGLLDQLLADAVMNQRINQLAAASAPNAPVAPPEGAGDGHFIHRKLTIPELAARSGQ